MIDSNPEVYELLFVDHRSIVGLVEEILRLTGEDTSTIWEVFSGIAEHSKEMLYREKGSCFVTFNSEYGYRYIQEIWREKGLLEQFSVKLLKPNNVPSVPISLAFCTNYILLQSSILTPEDLEDHLNEVKSTLIDKGVYIIYYGNVDSGLLSPARLKNFNITKNNKSVKAIMKFSNLKWDWIRGIVNTFMTITAENTKLGKEIMKPIAEDVSLGLFSPGDICRSAKRVGFRFADVYLRGAVNPAKNAAFVEEYPCIKLVK